MNGSMPKTFAGFDEPRINWFALPNNFFDVVNFLRERKDAQITAELKILLFLQCNAWHLPDGISERQIRLGIRRGRAVIDSGTGLDERTLKRSLELLQSLGVIVCENDRYKIRVIRQDHRKTNPTFNGFPPVEENFFKVPNLFLDLISPIKSAVTICTLLYLIRHSWGYKNHDGCWMNIHEINLGRKKAEGSFDQGIGFDEKTIYRSLQEAITAGFVVWTDRNLYDQNLRNYTLRFINTKYDPNSHEFLGQFSWEADEEYDIWLASRDFVDDRRDFVGGCRDFVDGRRDFAGGCRDFVDGCRDFVDGRRDFAGPDRDFADSCRGFDERNDVNTLRQIETHENTPPTTPFLENIVANAIGTSSDRLLKLLGVYTKNSRKKALQGGLSYTEIISWALYSWNQFSIKDPVAFLIKQCCEGDEPPEAYFRLATCPVSDLFSDEHEFELPPAFTSIVEPYRQEKASIETIQLLNQPSAIVVNPDIAAEIWNQVKYQLAPSIKRIDFVTWVSLSRGVSWELNELTVSSVNSIASDWIAVNLGEKISTVMSLTHPGSRVKFIVTPPA